MGYAFGQDGNGREIGYGVEATCDLDGCDASIDRGLAHRCGPLDNETGDSDVPGCGGFFCFDHLAYMVTEDNRIAISAAPGGGFCPPCLDELEAAA